MKDLRSKSLENQPVEVDENRLRRWLRQQACAHVGVDLIEERRGGAWAKRAGDHGLNQVAVELEGLEKSGGNSFRCCTDGSNGTVGIAGRVRRIVGAVAIGVDEVVGAGGVVSAVVGCDVVGRIRKEVGKVSRLVGLRLLVNVALRGVRTASRRSAGGSLRGVGSWWSEEGCATLPVVLLRSSRGTHEYSRGPWTDGSSLTGGHRCAVGAWRVS